MTNDDLMKLSIDDLCGILQNKYGFQADPGIPQQTLIDQILKCQSDNIQSAVTTTETACKEYERLLKYSQHYDKLKGKNVSMAKIDALELLEPEPSVQVRFNHQDGDHELKFRFSGGLRIPLKSKGKRKRWAMLPPLWHLISGHTYTVPHAVYVHLNTRIVPDSKLVTDETTGEEKPQPYLRRRMSAEVVLSRDQAVQMQRKEPVHADQEHKVNRV